MPYRVHPGSPACRFDCLHSRQHMQSDHVCELTGSRPLLQKAVCAAFTPKSRQRRKWSRQHLETLLESQGDPQPVAPPPPPPDRPILVVEDDHSIAGFVQTTLTEEGYRVLVASTGAEALTQAAAANPWLVLLDIGLPQMDGWTVADRLHRILGNSYGLILMSAQKANPERARTLGALDWLSKPFGVSDLLLCVGYGRSAGLTGSGGKESTWAMT